MSAEKRIVPAQVVANWRMKGQLLIDLARLLDDYVQREKRDASEKAKVQAEEALYAAANQQLWRGVLEARVSEDWALLAEEMGDVGGLREEMGASWRAEIWFVLADRLRDAWGETA